jgi:hypothetical protein
MPSELVPRLDRALARQHVRDLQTVYRRAELANAELSGIASVTQRAIYRALETNIVRAQAEQIEPDGAEHYALLAAVGVTKMSQVIASLRCGS